MADQAIKQSEDKTSDQSKIKIKVQGQEKEVSLDELKELAQKGEDYTQKTQTLAEKEKALKQTEEEIKEVKIIVDEMKVNPELGKVLNKAYEDFKSGKISKSDAAKDRNLKELDRMIEEVNDPDQRENLRVMRKIIAEESGTEELSSEIKKLREEVAALRSVTSVTQLRDVEGSIKKLEDEFGVKLVAKHKKNIESIMLKYPNQKAKNLLFNFGADDPEFNSLLLEQAKQKEKEEQERKKKNAEPGGAETATGKIEVPRTKQGRVDWKGLVSNIKEKRNLSV